MQSFIPLINSLLSCGLEFREIWLVDYLSHGATELENRARRPSGNHGLNEHDRIGERKCYAQMPSDVTLTKALVQSITTTSRAICCSSFSTSCLCAASALQPFPFILLLKHRARGAFSG